jgi:hypothetical protein
LWQANYRKEHAMGDSEDRKIGYGQAAEFIDGLVRKGFVKGADLQYLIEHRENMELVASLFSTGQATTKADGFEFVDNYAYHRQGALVLETGEHEFIGGGHWIIRGDAKVKKIESHAVIHEISGNAVVEDIKDAVVYKITGHAKVYQISGSTMVRNIHGNVLVGGIFGQTTVYSIRESAHVESLGGFVTVAIVDDDVVIDDIGSQVVLANVQGRAKIGRMTFHTLVHYRNSHRGNVTIGEVSKCALAVEVLPFERGHEITDAKGEHELLLKEPESTD